MINFPSPAVAGDTHRDTANLWWTHSGFDWYQGGVVTVAGSMYPFAGSVAPANFLLCDGAAVDRITYDGLFAVIGTVYGAGDGSTTFNLPDFSNRVSLGASVNYPVAQAGGEESHTLLAGEMPSHSHTIAGMTAVDGHAHSVSVSGIAINGTLSDRTGGVGDHTHTGNNYILTAVSATSGVELGVNPYGSNVTAPGGGHSHSVSGSVSGTIYGTVSLSDGGGHTPTGGLDVAGGDGSFSVIQPTVFVNFIIQV